MSENDRLDVLSLNTILPMKPVPSEFEYEVRPGLFQTITFQKWALAFRKWKQVDADRCPSYTRLFDGSDVILVTDNGDPEAFYAVERESFWTPCIVPGDTPLQWHTDPDTGYRTVVPSSGDWSDLGAARWEPIEEALFSEAARAMCISGGRTPFTPKVWMNIMSISDLTQWADVYRRIGSWRAVNRERIGDANVPRDAGDADDAFGSFLNGL